MPRNPDKKRCIVPGCQNWAMLGHARCRSHRDGELGSRGAGAPLGNLNALSTGQRTQALPANELESLVTAAVNRPQDLPYQVGLAVQTLQSRTGDTFRALLAVRALLTRLVDHVAERQFAAELKAVLEPLPPPARERLQAAILKAAARHRPERRLSMLRRLIKRRARTHHNT